jgi:hypothetical protein
MNFMYIRSKYKCQLSFDWYLDLIEICATQSWFPRNDGTLKISKWWLNLTNRNPWLSRFIISNSPL